MDKCENFQFIMDDLRGSQWKSQQHVLERIRLAKCLKLADKVYGALGLLNLEICSATLPDYTIPFTEVYITFARAWIESEKDLELLMHAGEIGNPRERRELDALDKPSWVPDLRAQSFTSSNPAHPPQDAGTSFPASFEFLSDGRVLSVRGVLLGSGDGLCERPHWVDDYGEFQDIGDAAQTTDATQSTNAYGDHEAFREALWRALVYDRDRHGNPTGDCSRVILDTAIFDTPCEPGDPGPTNPDHRDIHRNLHLWLNRNASYKLGGHCLKDYFLDLKALKETPKLYYETLHSFWLWKKRLAVTTSGYICVVKEGAQPGDVLAVVFGCSVPLLLRRKGDTFQIIAECYIQGMMKGEIVDLIRDPSGMFQPQDILLC